MKYSQDPTCDMCEFNGGPGIGCDTPVCVRRHVTPPLKVVCPICKGTGEVYMDSNGDPVHPYKAEHKKKCPCVDGIVARPGLPKPQYEVIGADEGEPE